MMNIFEAIKKRHSTRKYIDQDVDMHEIAVILEAARHAPSSGNLQAWRFIIVRDKKKRESLAEACQKQYWMAKAPVHIIVTAEVERVEQFYGIRGERLYAVQNCAAAIENILLTATALGIQSCWVGYFDEEALRSIVRIPEKSRPQAIITLGYEEFEEITEKADLHTSVFFESYGNRIEDTARAFGNWSDVWQNEIQKGKENLKRQKPKLEKHFETAKEHFKKAHEHLKKHIDKLRKKV